MSIRFTSQYHDTLYNTFGLHMCTQSQFAQSTKVLQERMSEVEESIQYLEAITRLKESKFEESNHQSNYVSPIKQTSPFGTAWESAESLIKSAPRTNKGTNANNRRINNRSRYQPTEDFDSDIFKRSNKASWHETSRDGVTTLRYSPDPRDGQNTSDSDDFYDDVPGYMRPLRRPMGKLYSSLK